MLIRFPADGASNRLDTFDDNRLARDLHQKLRSIEGWAITSTRSTL